MLQDNQSTTGYQIKKNPRYQEELTHKHLNQELSR